MYTRDTKISTTEGTISPYVDGIDVYNSKLLYLLSDPTIERDSYEIVVYEYRPDLIAKDYYGSEEYLPYVILSTGLRLNQFKKGMVISLIKKDEITRINKIS